MKNTIEPRTDALRRALAECTDACAADLAFLEAWEVDPMPGPGAALRIGQIRRANPVLAAAIRAELAAATQHSTIRRRVIDNLAAIPAMDVSIQRGAETRA